MAEKQTKAKPMKSFRIEPDLIPRLQDIAKKIDRPESWIINKGVSEIIPKLEEEANRAAA